MHKEKPCEEDIPNLTFIGWIQKFDLESTVLRDDQEKFLIKKLKKKDFIVRNNAWDGKTYWLLWSVRGFDVTMFNWLQEEYGKFLKIKNLAVSLRILHKCFNSPVEFQVIFIIMRWYFNYCIIQSVRRCQCKTLHVTKLTYRFCVLNISL